MCREGVVQNLSDFERSLPNNTWVGWAVNKLVGSPFKWSLQKVVDVVSPPAVEIDDNVEYIYMLALKVKTYSFVLRMQGISE